MKVICPRCDEQGRIVRATIIGTNIVLYVCDECEATWREEENISTTSFQDFSTIMNNMGYKGLWSELTNVDERWDET